MACSESSPVDTILFRSADVSLIASFIFVPATVHAILKRRCMFRGKSTVNRTVPTWTEFSTSVSSRRSQHLEIANFVVFQGHQSTSLNARSSETVDTSPWRSKVWRYSPTARGGFFSRARTVRAAATTALGLKSIR